VYSCAIPSTRDGVDIRHIGGGPISTEVSICISSMDRVSFTKMDKGGKIILGENLEGGAKGLCTAAHQLEGCGSI